MMLTKFWSQLKPKHHKQLTMEPSNQGGETIQQLRQETGARIKVEEVVGTCEERIINISSADR